MKTKKNCLICNKEFELRYKKSIQKFCSLKCMGKSKINKLNPTYKDGRTTKKYYCIEECGNQITYYNWKYNQKRCHSCATKRLYKLNILNNKGINNPAYIDGTSGKYPSAFNDELRESIRKRDNYECQNCGMTEEEHLIVRGIVLPIHHIDYNIDNCSEENLITVCEQCNLRANHNRDYWYNYYQYKINTLKEKINE